MRACCFVVHANQVFDVNDNLSSARKVLMGMSRRAVTNKIILLLIMVALVGGIAAVRTHRFLFLHQVTSWRTSERRSS